MPNELSPLDARVRLAIHRRFLADERAPSAADIAADLGVAEADAAEAFRRLATGRAIVLREGAGGPAIRMAFPFSADPTRFRVHSGGRAWWANCIWDALGIPVVLGADAHIEARCGDCDDALSVTVQGGVLSHTEGVVHFAVPAARWWDDIAVT